MNAALELRAAAHELSLRLETEGFPQIKMGVGISTDTALNAIVGGGTQYEYTVVGGMF